MARVKNHYADKLRQDRSMAEVLVLMPGASYPDAEAISYPVPVDTDIIDRCYSLTTSSESGKFVELDPSDDSGVAAPISEDMASIERIIEGHERVKPFIAILCAAID